MAKSKETTEQSPFQGFNILDLTNKINPKHSPSGEIVEDKPDLQAMEAAIKAEQLAAANVDLDEDETPEVPVTEPVTPKVEPAKVEGSNDDDISLKPFMKMLAEKGVVDFEETDEFQDDEDGVAVVIKKTIENQRKKDYEEMPDGMKKAYDWVKNGGTFEEYLDYFYGNVSYGEMKIEGDDTELQKAVIKDFLKAQDETDEDIESIVDKYEIGGILEDEAKRALKKLQKIEEVEKQKVIQTQAAKAEEGRKKAKDYWESVKKTIDEKDDVKGFKLTPKIKEKLWEHINKPVKDGKSQWVLNYQNNLDSQLLAAYLDLVGYDISKLERQVETKVSSDLRKKLGKYTDSRSRMSSSTGRTEINDEAPFEGFRKIKLTAGE